MDFSSAQNTLLVTLAQNFPKGTTYTNKTSDLYAPNLAMSHAMISLTVMVPNPIV